ncbi:uncharacterized protein DUF1761 [Leptospira meyeri]|uniref:Uncharacterized protein DUF1761 n=1 Tax=Leptospira meyeri TaxID=29508 RepID=A0A4R8N348_LEPME|nr:DUF1761 domain-containing protein [Leptospira meyeri]EKJ88187.1 PF08570 family protein [Leptospira meyeri serovar Hardjo str. Went 5]MCW7487938.1 DUF1761 domain-containing protein [Leptospira meyeri]TDY73686.1 uncharacterized protein DUF1761 [Leptospira meyeri]TGL53510.1 DUF1761 domain-containing protein [Leptospira meyeri]
MLQILLNLNWIGIGFAFLIYFFLGYIWFTILFTKPYRISLGKENETQGPPAPIFIIGPAICTLFNLVTTAILFSVLQINQTADALLWGTFVGIGYLSANTFNIAINPNIPRPILYGVISSVYHLVGINVAAMILVQNF